MAVFEIQGPDGATYEVDAPDEKSAVSAFQRIGTPPAPEKPGVIEDMAKAAPSAIARGVIGLPGLPGSIMGMTRSAGNWLADNTVGRAVNYARTGSLAAPAQPPPAPTNSILNLPTLDQVASGEHLVDYAAKAVPGIKYQPQTTPGEYTRTVGEFLPGLLSPGTTFQKVVGGVVVPAITSETFGQIARKFAPSLEPVARVAGGIGGSVASTLATRPANAQAAVSNALQGVDDATMVRAGQLMEAAQQRGVALTWPEAVNQVTNGGATGLSSLQHVVENSRGGSGVMAPFMAQRPAQVEAAGRQAFDTIAPQSQAPHTIGPAIGEAALQTATDARAVRSAQTQPFYARAATDNVPAADVNAIITQLDSIIARAGTPELAGPALQLRDRLIAQQATPGTPATRTPVVDPRTGNVIRYQTTPATPGTPAVPHTNVGRLDEVYGSARDQFTGPAPLGQTGTEARAARYAGEALEPLDNALQAASPALAQGRQVHQQVTRQFIDPLMQGPIGKLAERDLGTRQAIDALFPTNPLPGSAPEIVRTVGNLAQRNAPAAQQLVRAHVESVFNEATQALQSGANQFGGAGFAAVLRGNTQQAENLAAAIQGVGGPQVLQGFDEFLNIMSATGQRVRGGSRTAFNQEAQDILKRGGGIGEAANTVATAGIKLPAQIKERYEQWRLGQNTGDIARLITDTNALPLFRRLAEAAPGSNRAQAIAARLTAMSLQATQSMDNPVSKAR